MVAAGFAVSKQLQAMLLKKFYSYQESLLSEIKMTLKNCKIAKLPLFYRKIMQLKKK
jgi:hypothetical protein